MTGALPGCESIHCVTCSDAAEEMSVVAIDDNRGLALCEDASGVRHTVEIGLVLPVGLADRLLVHAGTAIARQGDVL